MSAGCTVPIGEQPSHCAHDCPKAIQAHYGHLKPGFQYECPGCQSGDIHHWYQVPTNDYAGDPQRQDKVAADVRAFQLRLRTGQPVSFSLQGGITKIEQAPAKADVPPSPPTTTSEEPTPAGGASGPGALPAVTPAPAERPTNGPDSGLDSKGHAVLYGGDYTGLHTIDSLEDLVQLAKAVRDRCAAVLGNTAFAVDVAKHIIHYLYELRAKEIDRRSAPDFTKAIDKMVDNARVLMEDMKGGKKTLHPGDREKDARDLVERSNATLSRLGLAPMPKDVSDRAIRLAAMTDLVGEVSPPADPVLADLEAEPAPSSTPDEPAPNSVDDGGAPPEAPSVTADGPVPPGLIVTVDERLVPVREPPPDPVAAEISELEQRLKDLRERRAGST